MNKVLILSDNKEFKKDLSLELNKLFGKQIDISSVSNRGQAIVELSQNEYPIIVIDCTFSNNDLQLLLKYLSTNDNFFKHIFFLSNNFEDFSHILQTVKFPYLSLVSLPVSSTELANLIRTKVEEKALAEIDADLKINLDFLKIFIDATKRVFTDFCFLTVNKHEKPFLKNNSNKTKYSVIGEIALKSEGFDGLFRIGFTKDFYLQMIERVLQISQSEIDHEILDFAGELVNMTYGQAKLVLNEKGFNFLKVIPRYELVENDLLLKFHTIVVPISTDLGTTYIEIEVIKVRGYQL